jgi:Zn-dependent peptidase ImmA (M78 family)
MAGKDSNTGAKRARQTRAELGLGAGAPVGCLLTVVERQLELPVVVAALPHDIAGCCWHDGARVVLWVNGTHAAVRQRFTLAHEVGHVRCRHDARVAIDTYETLAGRTTDSREIQANAFAAELLAPAEGVRAMVERQPTLDDVVLVAARFGISTVAALYRLNALGLTTRYKTLKQEIDEGMHTAAWDRLAPKPVADVIADIERATLPRLSPILAGSALDAVIAGSASVDDAAGAAGCDPNQLAGAAAAIGA